MLVARALPAGLGAAAKCKRYSLTGPYHAMIDDYAPIYPIG
jgi:hypothetical protein